VLTTFLEEVLTGDLLGLDNHHKKDTLYAKQPFLPVVCSIFFFFLFLPHDIELQFLLFSVVLVAVEGFADLFFLIAFPQLGQGLYC
jgi:hypothetical protein